LKFRNELAEERNLIENRLPTRRNKTEAINQMGSYTPVYRADVLRRLLETQKEVQITKPHIELITNQELIAIQVIWYRDLLFNNKVSDIYNNIFKNSLDMKQQEEKNEKELQLLQDACNNNKNDFDLIQELLTLQKNKSLLNKKRGLKDDIENRIEEFLKKAK
jgi:DNA sulfur modification protein DndC